MQWLYSQPNTKTLQQNSHTKVETMMIGSKKRDMWCVTHSRASYITQSNENSPPRAKKWHIGKEKRRRYVQHGYSQSNTIQRKLTSYSRELK